MNPITFALNAGSVFSEKGSPDTKLRPAVLLRGDVVDGNPLLDYELSHGCPSGTCDGAATLAASAP
jgi:hypothetical protein